jgi:polar amino acid transport system substrate-binding protein
MFSSLCHRDDYPTGYVRGVGEGMWWAGSTITANEPVGRDPSRAWSRVVSLIWVFAGIILVANLTASISSQLTVQSIQGQINGVDDLVGKKIVTVARTTAAKELTVRGLRYAEVPKIEDAYAELLSNRAEAIVYDAPVLQYRSSHAGKGNYAWLAKSSDRSPTASQCRAVRRVANRSTQPFWR